MNFILDFGFRILDCQSKIENLKSKMNDRSGSLRDEKLEG
jgi:hypothetical protein